MYSFGFPEMLMSNTSKLLSDKDAVRSNVLLVLNSERNTLFGDPYFGTALKQAFFEQSNSLIVDLLIDEIYTTLITFIPQIYIERKNIVIYSDGTDLFAEISYIYVIDSTSDLYVINLTNIEAA